VVDLLSFGEPYLQNLVSFYQSMRREIWVLDLTSDLGIPIFAALSRRVEAPTEEIIFGFGAHFDPEIGILRAVTEMNQSLPFVLTGADDPKNYPVGNQESKTWWQTATVAHHAYLLPASQIKPKVQADYETVWHDDLQTGVERCVDLAKQQGLETLVLDQTRPDIGLTVVKVIVPGLRHFWPRFGPGRLYDVPVKLGWLAAPLSERQLNPQHIFI
jgi:ribosomal protein S12 methylthiotransferase accessory factor